MPHISPLLDRVSRCLVLALLTGTLAACGGGSSGTASPAPAPPTQPETPAPAPVPAPDAHAKPEMRCAP